LQLIDLKWLFPSISNQLLTKNRFKISENDYKLHKNGKVVELEKMILKNWKVYGERKELINHPISKYNLKIKKIAKSIIGVLLYMSFCNNV
jgi:hypothetical protein